LEEGDVMNESVQFQDASVSSSRFVLKPEVLHRELTFFQEVQGCGARIVSFHLDLLDAVGPFDVFAGKAS
jgi:hypothetical protein